MITPYPSGNSTADIIARTLAQKLSASLGVNVFVENRPGGSAMIGTEAVARAAPDGYTILLGATGPNAINVSLFKKIAYDPVNDFAPVALVAVTTSVLVVHPSVPANSVAQLIKLAKTRNGKLNYGSAGVGGTSHLAGELFNTMAGVKTTHVPYRGMAPAVIDLIGGQVDFMFATLPGTQTQIQAGRLRALAVATDKRSEVLPNLPTMSEAGLPGFQSSSFFGLFAPAKTPADIVNKLNEHTNRALKLPDVRDMMRSQGSEVGDGTPEQFATFVRAEIKKWAAVIKASGATAED
jgi:tripartite-type tricarboxylate transporter receptor subunit TctC